MNKNLVKHNINFLEYPLWFQDESLAENSRGVEWTDREGYLHRAGYKVPIKTDAIFLLYLLLQSQRIDYSPEIILTRYQVLKDCNLVISKVWYDRLEDSLERWKNVSIKFTGSFYDGKKYDSINFGIIDAWKVDEKTKKLHIRFSPEFLTMMRGKGFFKYIDFHEFKKLKSPLATRLYEILSKSFHSRDTWNINAIKLAQKIPMKEKYPAHIVPKIKTALNRINKHANIKFSLEVDQTEHGKCILYFTKVVESKPVKIYKKPRKLSFVAPDNLEISTLMALLPEERQTQQSIVEILSFFYKEHGFDYVARNIRYTNKNAKTGYRAYLSKALKNDYGFAMQEDEEALQRAAAQEKLERKQAQQKKDEEKRHQQEQEINKKRVQEYIENLSEENKANLQAEALASLSDKLRKIVENKGPGSKIMLNIAMEKIALERIKSVIPKQTITFTG